MKPETKMEIMERQIVEAEAAILRQRQLIAELEKDGHSIKGSLILLELLEETLRQAQAAHDTMRVSQGL